MKANYFLVDASVLRGHSLLGQVKQDPYSIALYQDLGEEAESIGPWLVPAQSMRLPVLALPQRHGVSEICTHADMPTVVQHFADIRYLQTDDGQQFYFRYADMRTLQAAERALPGTAIASLKGCITHWHYTNRDNARCEFAADRPGTDQPLPPLRLAQFEALVKAGAADRLALSLQELTEPGLDPVVNAQQFKYTETALRYIEKHAIQHYPLQVEIAKQIVLSQANALQSPKFDSQVARAVKNGDVNLMAPLTPQAAVPA
jgi:Domain of unknown function (DUF4123)